MMCQPKESTPFSETARLQWDLDHANSRIDLLTSRLGRIERQLYVMADEITKITNVIDTSENEGDSGED